MTSDKELREGKPFCNARELDIKYSRDPKLWKNLNNRLYMTGSTLPDNSPLLRSWLE